MRLIFFVTITFFSLFAQPFVKKIDATSIEGTWYEIARTYNSFEEGCIAPTIEYIYESKKKLTVFNRCITDIDKEMNKEYKGSVELIETDLGTAIEKTYFLFFSQEYYMLYFENNFFAIMTDKSYKNIWIMSRTPFIEDKKLKEFLSILENYIDIEKLIYPKQFRKEENHG